MKIRFIAGIISMSWIFNRFRPEPVPNEAGFVTDFLNVRTRGQPTVAVTIDDDAAPIGAEEIDEADDASSRCRLKVYELLKYDLGFRPPSTTRTFIRSLQSKDLVFPLS